MTSASRRPTIVMSRAREEYRSETHRIASPLSPPITIIEGSMKSITDEPSRKNSGFATRDRQDERNLGINNCSQVPGGTVLRSTTVPWNTPARCASDMQSITCKTPETSTPPSADESVFRQIIAIDDSANAC